MVTLHYTNPFIIAANLELELYRLKNIYLESSYYLLFVLVLNPQGVLNRIVTQLKVLTFTQVVHSNILEIKKCMYIVMISCFQPKIHPEYCQIDIHLYFQFPTHPL